MPSSGLPMENFAKKAKTNVQTGKIYKLIQSNAEHSMKQGLFIEWLENFVGAWNKTKDPFQAANAGIIEWDM